MKRFVAGADRGQSTLLPECLDDFIDESNAVRAIDAFVDALDLADWGLTGWSRRRQAVRRITLRFC
jgi:transposase